MLHCTNLSVLIRELADLEGEVKGLEKQEALVSKQEDEAASAVLLVSQSEKRTYGGFLALALSSWNFFKKAAVSLGLLTPPSAEELRARHVRDVRATATREKGNGSSVGQQLVPGSASARSRSASAMSQEERAALQRIQEEDEKLKNEKLVRK